MRVQDVYEDDQAGKCLICKAPEKVNWAANDHSVFLAGSIDMGKAVNWQKEVEDKLKDLPVTILNPRRDDWDSSWEQTIKNKQFKEQVDWELDCQENCDLIFMVFSKDSQAPITLLELGLFHKRPMVIVCDKDYWRRGNVEVVCDRYDIPLYAELDEGLDELKKRMSK